MNELKNDYNTSEQTLHVSDQQARKRFSRIAYSVIFLLGISVGLFGANVDGSTSSIQTTVPDDVELSDVDFDLFWQVWETIHEDHVGDDISDNDLIYSAVAGLVEGLDDPHSVFFDPVENEEFIDSINGDFEGIGAEISIKDDQLTVVAPLPDSPAEKSGLLAGDKILAVDGADTTNMSLSEAVQKIRGEKGTVVALIIQRGEEELQEIFIERDTIHLDSVEWEFLEEENLAYIAIYQFSPDTGIKFEEAVNELLLNEPDGLIIDVRNNPGGYLEAAVQLSSKFIAAGNPVVFQKMNEESENSLQAYESSGASPLREVPTVILIDGGSASASEILAGALQDYDKATVIGTTSFGKGTVQTVKEFEDGSSLKLTIAKWLTPKQQEIDGIGIYPDYYVERTREEFLDGIDKQMDAAKLYFTDNKEFTTLYEVFDPESVVEEEEETQQEQDNQNQE